MRTLGIDPGFARIGWGVVDSHSGKVAAVAYGCIEIQPKTAEPERLGLIYKKMQDLIDEHNPEAVAVEELFFNTNAKTALKVGEARGVIVLSAVNKNVECFTYTPLQVKSAVTGFGRAEKQQVGRMIKMLLNLDAIPKPDDTTDALAVALAHTFSFRMKMKSGSNV